MSYCFWVDSSTGGLFSMTTGYFQWDWHTILLNSQCFIILYLHQHIDTVFINLRAQKKDEWKHFEKTDSHKVSKLLVKVGKLQNAVIVSLNIVRMSALTTEEGRNPDKFLFTFWEKRWLYKFILKIAVKKVCPFHWVYTSASM